MYLTKDKKEEVFSKHSLTKNAKDTGSAQSQVALFTMRINHLTEHMKKNRHDFSTQMGLLRLVGKRRKMLNHMQKTEVGKYRTLIAELGIRK